MLLLLARSTTTLIHPPTSSSAPIPTSSSTPIPQQRPKMDPQHVDEAVSTDGAVSNDEDTTINEWTRVMGGYLVGFKDGAAVNDVYFRACELTPITSIMDKAKPMALSMLQGAGYLHRVYINKEHWRPHRVLVTAVEFRIPTRIYDVVQDQLDGERPEWAKRHVQFTASPPTQGYRALKLEGEDSNSVSQAKTTLERIVDGEVVSQNENSLWHPALGKDDGGGVHKLKGIEQECRVVILRDKRKAQIRLFGRDDGRKRASERVVTLVEELEETQPSKGRRVVELDAEAFKWVFGRGGYKALQVLLGDNKVKLEVTTPKRLIIYGSWEGYKAAVDLISENCEPAQWTEKCPICWSKPVNPIRLDCNHVYCMQCFEGLREFAVSPTTLEFRVSCTALTCKIRPIPLSELQTQLPPPAFEDLLEHSFDKYVGIHHGSIRYCPTPDCGHVYRSWNPNTSDVPETFACHNCLVLTCTPCNVPHPGMTCAEHEAATTGGGEAAEREDNLRESGLKECPVCKIAIERVDGCDRVTCTRCWIHICWLCPGVVHFDCVKKCYHHLREVHDRNYRLDEGGDERGDEGGDEEVHEEADEEVDEEGENEAQT